MQMFDPTLQPKRSDTEFQLYGREHVNSFSTHSIRSEDNAEQLEAEWNNFKDELSAWHIAQLVQNGKQAPVEWVLTQLRKQSYSYRGPYPLLMKVVEALVVIPVSNACPETGITMAINIAHTVGTRSEPQRIHWIQEDAPISASRTKWEECKYRIRPN